MTTKLRSSASNGCVTTGIAARLLGVSIRTVQTWCDEEHLDCSYLPSGSRRIRIQDVLEFALSNSMSLAADVMSYTGDQLLSFGVKESTLKHFGISLSGKETAVAK